MSVGTKAISEVLQTCFPGHGFQSEGSSGNVFNKVYRSITGLFRPSDGEPTPEDAAAHIITLLLDGGLVCHRDLEGRMGRLGFSPPVVRQAIQLLAEGSIVKTRADGVTIDQEKRKLFL